MIERKKLKDIVKGDTFAYEITFDKEYKGRYLILWETDLHDDTTTIRRCMRLKITKDHNLPKNQEEFQKLEDVITTITGMEERFYPFSSNNIDEEIKEKSKVKVYPDEYDYLYSYTLGVYCFTNLYKSLIYLGNYEINNDMKYKEFLPFSLVNLWSAYARRNSLEDFEHTCLFLYRSYNLRESGLWDDETGLARKARVQENKALLEAGKKAVKGVKSQMTVLDLLHKIVDNKSILPTTIKVDNVVYSIDIETNSYLLKENNHYRELTHDLSRKMPPKEWLLLNVEIVPDEEYTKN